MGRSGGAHRTLVLQRVKRDENRPGLFEAIVTHPGASLRVVGIVMVETLTYYVWLTYLPTYAHESSGIPLPTALTISTATTVVFVLLTPVAGILSDRVGRKPLMIAPTVGFAGGMRETAHATLS